MAPENPFETINNRFQNLEVSIEEIKRLLNHHDDAPQQEYGGVELAMEVTMLSSHSIYRLVHERKIPHAKRGGRLYFSRKELRSWISKGQRQGN